MKKVLKWIGIVLGVIIAALLVIVIGLFAYGNMRSDKVHTFPDDNISIPTDAASIEHGKHLALILCVHCHGADLGGKNLWFNFPPAGTIDTPNLTSGDGGIGGTFTDRNYVQAIRHAINPQGRGTSMVSVASFQYLSDSDLGDIVAYLKTAPPVNHKTDGSHFTPLARVLLGAGILPWPVESVSHASHITAPTPGVTVEYGKYLVDSGGCRDCHGLNLSGGPYPQPGITFTVPNITPGGEPKLWSEAQFISTIRTGVTPGGHQLNANLMPWNLLGQLSDDELKAIWMYLQTVPAMAQGGK